MKLTQIIKQEPLIELEDGVRLHESIFQAYHIVDFVYNMAKRGDSTETIVEVIDLIKDVTNTNKNEKQI